jgi:hypothetical protein
MMNTLRMLVMVVMVGLVTLMVGCSTQNGLLAKVQNADEALATKYGVPVSIVKGVRSTLGIPDARTLPDASRIAPVGWVVYYDLLDREDKIIDQTQFHWSTTPKLKQTSSTGMESVFNPAPDKVKAQATLESVLDALKKGTNVVTSSSIGGLLP